MADEKRPVVMWFRRDLRLSDNPALSAAAKADGPLLPLFILDDDAPGHFRLGGASRWWLHGSLESLGKSLDGHLILRRGKTAEILEEVLDETEASAIHTAAAYEPYERDLEDAVEKLCSDRSVGFERHEGRLLNAPDAVRTNDGDPYQSSPPTGKQPSESISATSCAHRASRISPRRSRTIWTTGSSARPNPTGREACARLGRPARIPPRRPSPISSTTSCSITKSFAGVSTATRAPVFHPISISAR
ncbi:Deoxyribodipyrimidine photo-lyase [Methyloligella halotolerans]|uniref:Deoxyribodipyrimidine photo-lyase n=1 Tax=Methyloligella halotolerans TaxID=1177755 RepID=A0A1E2RVS6_9HYPH|nr:Deoxyribodipyrimidine photo-lyase [Methyloligella halotolerans]